MGEDATKYSPVYRTNLHNKKLSGPNINSDDVEKPCSTIR